MAHAATPWRYPKLYPAEWLQDVSERNVIYTLEPRHLDGIFVTQRDFKPRVYVHKSRDLAVLHLDEEDAALQMLSKTLKNSYETRLDFVPEDSLPATGRNEPLFFHGHNIEQKPVVDMDTRLMLPHVEKGTFLGRTPAPANQCFVRTENVLQDGMCGGPVCEDFDLVPFADGKKSIVRGLLEGIVPTNHPSAEIAGTGVFVEAGEIRRFLQQIEQDEVEPLTVGDVAEIVGQDQDQDKMDITKFL